MVRVRQPHRYDHMADPQVERIRKMFRDMELFQSHFTAFFDLGFDLAALFIVLDFLGRTGSAVLELNLGTQVPPFAEVIIECKDGPGQRHLGAVIPRRPDRIRIPVRSVSHVLEQDFPVSADTILFEVPLERRFTGCRIGRKFLRAYRARPNAATNR